MRRQWTDYVRERIISQPGRAVVVRLAREHLVARSSSAGRVAISAGTRVVPHGEDGASRAYRQVGLPLGGGTGIGVQLQWRAKVHTIVCGADVVHVSVVGSTTAGSSPSALSIDVVNDVVVGARFTPAHVAPVSGVEHGGEIGVAEA